LDRDGASGRERRALSIVWDLVVNYGEFLTF
jgi:hypothetical protein